MEYDCRVKSCYSNSTVAAAVDDVVVVVVVVVVDSSFRFRRLNVLLT